VLGIGGVEIGASAVGVINASGVRVSIEGADDGAEANIYTVVASLRSAASGTTA
jgi:hypothetical protein